MEDHTIGDRKASQRTRRSRTEEGASPLVRKPDKCRMCGHELPSHSGPGQPRQYCGRRCADLSHSLAAWRRMAAGSTAGVEQ